MKTRTALVSNPWTAYNGAAQPVKITRSKSRAAGTEGVTFTAPGWRTMVFRSMEAAERKLQAHPGFEEWAS